MKPLFETHRPRSFAAVLGQAKAVALIDQLRPRGLAGRSYWISGPSGSGKTTLARLIAAEVASDWATEEIDAQDCSLDTIRQFEKQCQGRPLGGKGWAFIVNEAHGLAGKSASRLLTVLEQEHVQRNSTWIFTTTTKGQQRFLDDSFDANPFLSRCIQIKLESPDELDAAMWAQSIARAERLDGQPLSVYVSAVRQSNGNLRDLLQRIEAGEMLSKGERNG